MFQRNGPSAGAEEAERLDLEKHATAEHQHREGLAFWQAIKAMFK